MRFGSPPNPSARRCHQRDGRARPRRCAASLTLPRVVFSAADAEAWAARGEQVLLVRDFTSPKDIRGMDAAQAILIRVNEGRYKPKKSDSGNVSQTLGNPSSPSNP